MTVNIVEFSGLLKNFGLKRRAQLKTGWFDVALQI
jgi:hypothetical protein